VLEQRIVIVKSISILEAGNYTTSEEAPTSVALSLQSSLWTMQRAVLVAFAGTGAPNARL
jgi:hypothetical protein